MAVGQLRKAPVTRERPSIPSMPIPVSLLASPTQPHRGRVYSLPPENCTHFPTATKLGGRGGRERETKHHTLHAGKPRGTSFPGFNHAPVPQQGAMSLSLSRPLCSGKAVQGAWTQHSSEEFDIPGRAHSRFKASNLLQTGFPETLLEGKLHHQTRKISGSPRAQCQDSTACTAHERGLNSLPSPS